MSDDKIDFFDGEDIEDTQKANNETPEQKEDREIADNTIERGRSKFKKIMYGMVAAFVLFFILWMWLRYFHPSTSMAQRRGYVMEVKCVGTLFKTFEGQMISEEMIADTSKIYQRDFTFSITNDSIAKSLMNLQGRGKKIVLTYKEYQGTLPWRGSTGRIVTSYEVQP